MSASESRTDRRAGSRILVAVGAALLLARSAPAQDLLAEANAAYQTRDFARCGDLRARALEQRRSPGIAFGAAICFALAQDAARALDLLEKAIALGFNDAQALENLPALDVLRADPRWRPLLERARARRSANESADNPRLRELREADQADRTARPVDWTTVSRRDAARRQELVELLGSARVRTGCQAPPKLTPLRQ